MPEGEITHLVVYRRVPAAYGVNLLGVPMGRCLWVYCYTCSNRGRWSFLIPLEYSRVAGVCAVYIMGTDEI